MTAIDKWQNTALEAQLSKTAELAIRDAKELEQYRSTGLNPVQVRALNNSLTIMRTFIESVDSDEYSLKPLMKSKAEKIAEFWEDVDP